MRQQNEVALAGLHAIESQSVELAGLQQQESILKEQKACYAASATGKDQQHGCLSDPRVELWIR